METYTQLSAVLTKMCRKYREQSYPQGGIIRAKRSLLRTYVRTYRDTIQFTSTGCAARVDSNLSQSHLISSHLQSLSRLTLF